MGPTEAKHACFSGPAHGYIAAGARLAGGGAVGILLVTPLEGGTGLTGKRADTGRGEGVPLPSLLLFLRRTGEEVTGSLEGAAVVEMCACVVGVGVGRGVALVVAHRLGLTHVRFGKGGPRGPPAPLPDEACTLDCG